MYSNLSYLFDATSKDNVEYDKAALNGSFSGRNPSNLFNHKGYPFNAGAGLGPPPEYQQDSFPGPGPDGSDSGAISPFGHQTKKLKLPWFKYAKAEFRPPASDEIIVYLYPHSYHAQVVAMALHVKQIPFTAQILDINKGDQFNEEFLKLSPRGEVPVLNDGVTDTVVTDTFQILRHLESNISNNGGPSLLPDVPGQLYNAENIAQRLYRLKVDSLTFGTVVYFDLDLDPHGPYKSEANRDFMREFISRRRAILRTEAHRFPQYAEHLNKKLADVQHDWHFLENRDDYEDLIISFERELDECEAELQKRNVKYERKRKHQDKLAIKQGGGQDATIPGAGGVGKDRDRRRSHRRSTAGTSQNGNSSLLKLSKASGGDSMLSAASLPDRQHNREGHRGVRHSTANSHSSAGHRSGSGGHHDVSSSDHPRSSHYAHSEGRKHSARSDKNTNPMAGHFHHNSNSHGRSDPSKWWLCSPDISMADLFLFMLLWRLYELGFYKRLISPRPNLVAYFHRMGTLESFRKATNQMVIDDDSDSSPKERDFPWWLVLIPMGTVAAFSLWGWLEGGNSYSATELSSVPMDSVPTPVPPPIPMTSQSSLGAAASQTSRLIANHSSKCLLRK